ncbi:hypothetical protein ONQ97_26830, partial [Salmonella enterica subsp. enterica serovar Virginia]|nr:hypothetical protein [Salmonella enterica subsp. enterica serovar Virginia]
QSEGGESPSHPYSFTLGRKKSSVNREIRVETKCPTRLQNQRPLKIWKGRIDDKKQSLSGDESLYCFTDHAALTSGHLP